jgi:hypothetical protein
MKTTTAKAADVVSFPFHSFRNISCPEDIENGRKVFTGPTCKRLGLTGVSWHWLRHANATLLDAVGTPLGTVQALLGHSSAEITREIYLHSIPADARTAVQKVEDLLIGPKWTQVVEIQKNGSSLIQ